MLCRRPWSFKRARHHCRHCGVACCDECSPKRAPIPKFGAAGAKPMRCCTWCLPIVERSVPPAGSAAASAGAGKAGEATARGSRMQAWAEHAAARWRESTAVDEDDDEREVEDDSSLLELGGRATVAVDAAFASMQMGGMAHLY